MDYLNSHIIDGRLIASEAIAGGAIKVPIIPGATTLADIDIDWSLANTYILDMSTMDLSGGGTTATLRFINGSADNIKNRLIVKQGNVTANFVTLTFTAFDNANEDTTFSIPEDAAIYAKINAIDIFEIFDFELFDQSFVLAASGSTSAGSPTLSGSSFDLYDGAPNTSVVGTTITLTHGLNVSTYQWALYENGTQINPGSLTEIDADTIDIVLDPMPLNAENISINITKLS